MAPFDAYWFDFVKVSIPRPLEPEIRVRGGGGYAFLKALLGKGRAGREFPEDSVQHSLLEACTPQEGGVEPLGCRKRS